jgi:hypothetical protein
MSDKPWEQQPGKPGPSLIITPVDTIQITIDNRVNPPVVTFGSSRALPIPYVIHLMCGLIRDMIEKGVQQSPGIRPGAEPAAKPPNGSQ